jgi:hypothetical protein
MFLECALNASAACIISWVYTLSLMLPHQTILDALCMSSGNQFLLDAQSPIG